MLKLEPLVGIGLLDIPPRLGLCIVDREMGGVARAPDESSQIGKLEARLLSLVVAMIVNEWCGTWADLMEVRPTVLGTESNSRFLRTARPGTSMLVVGLEVRLGEMVEQMQFAFPHPMLEPLTTKLNAGLGSREKQETATRVAPPRWNALFDEMTVEVKAFLPDIELPAGKLACLKPGDVLPISPELMTHVRLRVADHPGFAGTLGASHQRRAVRIDRALGASGEPPQDISCSPPGQSDGQEMSRA
jgi:flagellar motor switch protein FliM